jgi:hypothetical protein
MRTRLVFFGGVGSIVFAATAFAPSVFAQSFVDLSGMSGGSNVVQSSFTLSADPSLPAPYGTTVVSFTSTSMDLSNANLVLLQNGKKIYDGAVQPITITLGAPGTTAALKATITSAGVVDTETLAIRPEDVSLVLEPLSTAPPLYPGKPLPAIDGSVRAVAVADFVTTTGKHIDPAALSYEWTVDGTRYTDGSGIGKSAALIQAPLQYRSIDISVQVSSPDGLYAGGAATTIAVTPPTLRLYENDPLLGIRFDHALGGNYTISGAESSVYAAPFSFPLVTGPLSINWFLNNQSVQTGNAITLRPSGEGTGSAALSVTATNGANATAVSSLSLLFGTPASGSFFGL